MINLEKIILKNERKIEIAPGSFFGAVTVVVNDFAELSSIAEDIIKPENVETVRFLSGDTIIETRTGMKLESPVFRDTDVNEEGRVVATFSLREKTELEQQVETILDSDVMRANIMISRIVAQELADDGALKVKAIYPTWDELVKQKFTAKDAGYKFTHQDVLYKTIKPGQQFQAQWVPGQGTESIFIRIDETHAGTQEDPIPYHVNMEVLQGKYYTEDGILYKCTRNSGQALHNKAAELVGHYFEVVG